MKELCIQKVYYCAIFQRILTLGKNQLKTPSIHSLKEQLYQISCRSNHFWVFQVTQRVFMVQFSTGTQSPSPKKSNFWKNQLKTPINAIKEQLHQISRKSNHFWALQTTKRVFSPFWYWNPVSRPEKSKFWKKIWKPLNIHEKNNCTKCHGDLTIFGLSLATQRVYGPFWYWNPVSQPEKSTFWKDQQRTKRDYPLNKCTKFHANLMIFRHSRPHKGFWALFGTGT